MKWSRLRSLKTFILIVVTVIASHRSTSLSAAMIGIDFGDENATAALTPSTVAGVVPQSNWNSFVAVSEVVNQSTPIALIDHSGSLSGASVSWTGVTNDWSLPIPLSDGNHHMMKGYLENISNGTITIAIRDIPYPQYDIYIYTDAEAGAATLSGLYAFSTSSGLTGSQIQFDPNLADFSGVFVQNQNYVRFASLTGDNVDLTSSVQTFRAPINAVQIVATVPEPNGMLLSILAIIVGVLKRRRSLPA